MLQIQASQGVTERKLTAQLKGFLLHNAQYLINKNMQFVKKDSNFIKRVGAISAMQKIDTPQS